MRRRLIFFPLVCILIVLLFAVSFKIINSQVFLSVFSDNVNNSVRTVIVDAGAVAPDNTLEKDLNLDIALRLEKILKLYGFNVIMTRTEDKMTYVGEFSTQRQKKVSDIRNRFKIIETNPNAIFVSIHQNKFYDATQKGAQVFYSHNNYKSKALAEEIRKSIIQNLQPENKRATKKSGTEIYLLYHSQIPSVLVECGFISNYNDLSLLKTEEYRQKTAILIADGILKYTLNG